MIPDIILITPAVHYLDEPVDTYKDGNSMSLMDIIAEDDNLVDRIDTGQAFIFC